MGNHTTVMNHGVMVKLNWRVGACYQSSGALSPDGQLKLKQCQTQMVPCSRGSINGTKNEGHRVHNVCSQEVTSQAGADDWII